MDLITATVFHRSGSVFGDLYLQLSSAGFPEAVYSKRPDGSFEVYPTFAEISAIYTASMRYVRHWDGQWMAIPRESLGSRR
jgi:hypothetical protein